MPSWGGSARESSQTVSDVSSIGRDSRLEVAITKRSHRCGTAWRCRCVQSAMQLLLCRSAFWARVADGDGGQLPQATPTRPIRRPGYAPAALTLADWLVTRRVLGHHWPVALWTWRIRAWTAPD